MKKRISNRALALILALSVLITAFAGAITTSALKIGELDDDFSNATTTESLWKTVDSDTGSSVSGVTAENGFIKLPTGYKNITLFDNASNTQMKNDGRTLEKVSYYMNLTTYGDRTTAPVIYYNPTTREYVHLIMSWSKFYGWQVAYGVNGSGRISTNLLYNGSNQIMDTNVFVRFDCTYNYDENHVIKSTTLSLAFYSDNTYSDNSFLGINKATLNFTGAVAKSAIDVVSNTTAQISRDAVEAITTGFQVGLRGGDSADNTNKIKVDKVEFTYSRTTDEEVLLYRARNATTLALTKDTATNSDLPAIATALSDYYSQKAATKTALASDYALLIGMRQKLYKETHLADYDYRNVFDDFEGYSAARSLDTIWTNYTVHSGEKVKTSAVVADEGGNKVLKQALAGSTGVATVIDDGLWLDRTIKSFEFDYQMVDTTAGGIVPTFYTYIDNSTDTPTYTYFTLTRNNTYQCIELKFGCNGFLKRHSGNNGVQLKWADGWDITKPLHIKTTFTSLSATNFYISTVATQGDCKITLGDTVTNTDGAYRYIKTGAKVGFAATDAAHQGSIDNFEINMVLEPDDKAFYFRNDNKTILARQASTIVEADRDAVVKALTDYSNLDVDSAEVLKTEKALLNQMAMKLEPSINTFLTKYGAMLEMNIDDIDHSYDALIDGALKDYATLSDLGKLVANITKLKAIKEHLVNLIIPVGNVWADGRTTYNDSIDFENGYQPFVKTDADTSVNSIFEVCDDPFGDLLDPENPEKGINHVLRIKCASNETVFRVINSALWPYKGQLTTLKFKVFIPQKDSTGQTGFPGDSIVATTLLSYLYDYVDDENYRGIFTSMGRKFGESRSGYRYYADGEMSGSGYTTQMGNSDLTSWVEYNLNYGSAAVSVSVDWSGNTGDTFSLAYTQGAKFGFQMKSGYGTDSTTYYVDDIEMSFKQGDFDINDEITDVNVYYSGNTFVHENETLMLTGEKLGNVVDKIEAYRLDDTDAGNIPTYIHAEDFQDSEVGDYKVTAPSEFIFDDQKATELPIVQRTAVGVKSIIPEGFDPNGDGIYAVKVTAKNSTYKVMLVNAPRINVVMGGDQNTLIAGEKVYVAGWNTLPTFDLSKARVALRSVSNPDNIYIFTPDTMHEDDEYYYEFTLPANFQKGEYEMFVHNGFGGSQAWSTPKLVNVGESARSSWPTTVFNVKDFGAVGDGDHNDTTAILNALNAAYLNGGGVVEFDRGIFRIDTTIPVPQNTVIRGVSTGETAILFSTYKWQYGEAKTLFSFVGNCALENFYAYSIRSHWQLYSNTPHASESANANHNVYINNVMFRGNYFAGQTSGAATMTSTGKYGNAELKMILETENNVYKARVQDITNLHIEDLDMLDECSTNYHGFSGTNIYIKNLDSLGWTPCGGVNCIFESYNTRGTGAVHADNAYAYGCTWGKGYTNNREMFTTDGGPKGSNLKLRFIGDDPDLMEYYTGSRKLDECTYAMVSGSAADDAWVGYNLLITGGQGMGQMRVITANRKYRATSKEAYRYTISIATPLTIRPNRNSTAFVVDHRTNTILVKNTLSEGSAGGIYGAGINWIFDMYDYSKADGINLTNRSSIIWYITFKNIYMHDSKVYIHSDHSGNNINGDQTGNCGMGMKSSTAPCTCGMMGVTIKANGDWTDENDTRGLLNGYGIFVSAGSTPNSLIEFVIEGMHFKNSETALSGIASGISGVLIRNNLIEDAQVSLGSDYLENCAKGVYELNKLQSPKCIIYLVEDGKAVDYLLGDVNGDGKVTLKDVTLVRYHYLEISTGTTQQVNRMDVNKDGKITLRDANQIRRYVLGLISFHTFNNEEDGEESSSNPSSSNPSSSNPSSSNPSSSNPSSSNPSSSNPSSSTISSGITTSEPNIDVRF